MDANLNNLFDGERLLLSKAANSIIKMSDHGLKRLPYDQLIRLIGFKNKEAIGGRLYLTNYRLIFKAHSMNRVTGQFSIFLPDVQDVRDSSRFILKKLTITTQKQEFEFVVWDIPELIQEINNSINHLTPEQRDYIKWV